MPPRVGLGRCKAREGARREGCEQDASHAVPEPQALPLGGIVQEGSLQQVGIVMPGREQAMHHVEAVPSIGDRHRREERPGPRRQDPTGELHLVRADASRQMPDELLDPMHPATVP